MNATETKETAQNELLGGMANAILAIREGNYGEPDEVLIAAMLKQAKRVMKLFGFESYPGLGNADDRADPGKAA